MKKHLYNRNTTKNFMLTRLRSRLFLQCSESWSGNLCHKKLWKIKKKLFKTQVAILRLKCYARYYDTSSVSVAMENKLAHKIYAHRKSCQITGTTNSWYSRIHIVSPPLKIPVTKFSVVFDNFLYSAYYPDLDSTCSTQGAPWFFIL